MTRLPQLWTEDLNGALRWIREFLAQDQTNRNSVLVDGAPVSSESAGMTRVWLGSTVPSGWLLLDGSYLFISEAEELYQAIGSAGGAPPPNMFKLPVAPTALASGMWIVKR